MKTILGTISEAKKAVLPAFKRVRFQFQLNRYKLRNWVRYQALPYMRDNAWLYGTIGYFFLLILLAYGPTQWLEANLPDEAVTFFTAAGAMVGGIPAVIFSLSGLLLVFASQQLPAGFYATAARDRALNWIYIAIALCSGLNFTFAVTYNSFSRGYVYEEYFLSLMSIGTVFYLMFLFYHRVRERLNPLAAVKRVHDDAISEIKRIENEAKKLAGIFTANPIPTEPVDPEMALVYSYQQFKPGLRYITRRLNYLFDYHDILVASHQDSTALTVLDAAKNILYKYLESRRDSSHLNQTGVFLATASDSQGFLAPQFERLVAIGKDYISQEKDVGITKVIEVFTDLCGIASDVNFGRSAGVDNPIFQQCRAYLDSVSKAAREKGHVEAIYQAAFAYSAIGKIAIAKSLNVELGPVYRQLQYLGLRAIVLDQDVILGRVYDSYNEIMGHLIQAKFFSFQMQFKALMKYVGGVTAVWLATYKGHQDGFYVGQQSIGTFYSATAGSIVKIGELAELAEADADRSTWRRMFLGALEEYYRSLRTLIEDHPGLPQNIILSDISRVIEGLARNCLALSMRPAWTRDKAQLVSHAQWYLHLPSWVGDKDKAFEVLPAYTELADSPARIGFTALKASEDTLAKESISVIEGMATTIMAKESKPSLYDAPRVMVRAALVGIYAFKLDKPGVVAAFRAAAERFKPAYAAKYYQNVPTGWTGTPDEDQLEREVRQLAQRMQERGYLSSDPMRRMIFNDAEDDLFEHVTPQDIESFADQIWPTAPAAPKQATEPESSDTTTSSSAPSAHDNDSGQGNSVSSS